MWHSDKYSNWRASTKLLWHCFVSLCWCGIRSGICNSYSSEARLDVEVVAYYKDSMNLAWSRPVVCNFDLPKRDDIKEVAAHTVTLSLAHKDKVLVLVCMGNLVIVGIFAYYYFLVLNMLPVIRIIHHSGILEMRIRPFFLHTCISNGKGMSLPPPICGLD